MAYISEGWCLVCQDYRSHLNNKCNHCADREAREIRAIWNSKTNEEKIESLLKRIQVLEIADGGRKYA
jgi:hypothetical protein